MEEKELLKHLIYLNGIIATELIQITENTSALLRSGEVPAKCLEAHQRLRDDVISILTRDCPGLVENLRKHLQGH